MCFIEFPQKGVRNKILYLSKSISMQIKTQQMPFICVRHMYTHLYVKFSGSTYITGPVLFQQLFSLKLVLGPAHICLVIHLKQNLFYHD